MNLKELASSNFSVVAVVDRGACPAQDFLLNGEKSTAASRRGLIRIVQHVAESGLDDVPSKWVHLANREGKIYEFISGSLRLFFFKGRNGQIAVCTGGTLKSGQAADPAMVADACRWRERYFSALADNTLEVV